MQLFVGPQNLSRILSESALASETYTNFCALEGAHHSRWEVSPPAWVASSGHIAATRINIRLQPLSHRVDGGVQFDQLWSVSIGSQ